MPQMAPLMWMTLFLIFSSIIIFSANKIWYMSVPNNFNLESHKSLKNPSFNWKWY